ncbi:hypothetical protein [Streptomyces sp. NPDC093149]
MTDPEKYRPPVEDRWTDGLRADPVRINIRAEWLYSCPSFLGPLPEGRTC